MVIHNSYPDFILFLYVHLSHADNSYDPAEMAAIKEKMKKLFPEGTDFEKKLYGALRQYNSFDRSKLAELFKSSFQHFNEVPSNVVSDMREIISADGHVNPSETQALETLRQMIDSKKK
ncbi:MAG TPA: TerB family tellurite resistance protein [Ohtaekwangia sp.]|nr:TerB family tellurite resistance protein [Ohtaekwangia sp.]